MKKTFTLIAAFILLTGPIFAQTWQPVNSSGTSFILYGMSFPPDQNEIGFACGMKYTWDAEGVIVKTTDGGENWQKIWPVSGRIDGLEGIWFINDLVGFAGGWNNYFIKTSDGGASWTPVSCGQNVWYYVDVVFWDENNGVAAAAMEGQSDQAVFITSDGGNSWVPATSGTQVNIQAISYADENTLFAVGTSGHVYKSIDKGHNWNVLTSLGPTLVGVDFANSTFGIVGGEESFYATNDGGETWITHPTGYEFFFGCKAFENGTAYWAGDDNIYKTTDYGSTFEADYMGPVGDVTYYRVRSTANGNLFASGSGGTIMKKNAPLTANFSASQTTVCMDESVSFTDLSTGEITSWNWTFEGGTPANSTAQNPTVTYANTGTFDVTLQVSHGFANNSMTINDMITVDDCTGIIDKGFSSFSIYPNPAKDMLNIRFRSENEENYLLILSNMLGQNIRIISGNIAGGDETLQINVSAIPEGQYIIAISTASGIFSHHKLMINR